VQGASAPPRPLAPREAARADVRSFSNLGLLSRDAMYESGYVEWDVDMVFEEPEAEHCLPSRSSPHRAARPALRGQRPPPSRTVAQVLMLMLPLALPVVQGSGDSVELEAEAGLPTRAAAAPSLAAIALQTFDQTRSSNCIHGKEILTTIVTCCGSARTLDCRGADASRPASPSRKLGLRKLLRHAGLHHEVRPAVNAKQTPGSAAAGARQAQGLSAGR
jgi:hypothetical protein